MKRLHKIALGVVAVVAVVSFSGCDEVSKVVDNATQKGKQLAQSASNTTKSSNSGGISISVSPSNSVCKNYYDKKIKEDKFLSFLDDIYRGGWELCVPFKNGSCSFMSTVINVPKKLLRSYATEFKKDGNETICVYFDTIAQGGFMNINLTQQEIVEFEKYLLDIGIPYDDYKSSQDGFLERLKFLKYSGLLKSLYSGEFSREGRKDNISREVWNSNSRLWLYNNMGDIFNYFENNGNIQVKKFVYDKPDVGVRLFYKNEPNEYNGGDGFTTTSLSKLRKQAETPDEKAILQWAEQKLKEAR